MQLAVYSGHGSTAWTCHTLKAKNVFAKVRLFLDSSCATFSLLKFMVIFCYDWVCYDYKFESTEDPATAIRM